MKTKTVFVTLFDGPVLFNFLLFPESVVRQLACREDTRAVLLVQENMIPLIKEHAALDAYPPGRISIEAVDTRIPRRTLIQKAFLFFYSYLIFTGTTKMLATFGARADTPPAGGSRRLVFLKALLARTLGRSQWIKTRVVPWLFKRFFISRVTELFRRYRPDLVFLSGIASWVDQEVLMEAQSRGIHTIGMPANWDHLNKYYIPLHVDELLVQNEPMREEAAELHEYAKEDVRVVGFPQFDFHVNSTELILPREEFLKSYGLSKDAKYVFYISSSVYCIDEPDVIERVVSWSTEGKFGEKVFVMLRAYPSRFDRKKYERFENHDIVILNRRHAPGSVKTNVELLNSLYHAEVVVSVFSTTAIEAAIFDKPVVTIGFDAQPRAYHQSVRRFAELSHFKHVLETGGVAVARSADDLFRHLNRYLRDPSADGEKRERLRQRMCYKLDGRSSGRVVGAITRVLHGR